MKDAQSKLFQWYTSASEDELELSQKAAEYEVEFFEDMTFDADSITGDFFKIEYEGKEMYEDIPFQISISDYIFKISKIKEAAGSCYPKKHIIKIRPANKDDKELILHEMIHAYEGILSENPIGKVLSELLLFSLYKNLNKRIKNIDEKIIQHSHIIHQEDIIKNGGFHGILFFLKSLDLDLRLNLPCGTVCGYGRDDYCASVEPASPKEAAMIDKRVREYDKDPSSFVPRRKRAGA